MRSPKWRNKTRKEEWKLQRLERKSNNFAS